MSQWQIKWYRMNVEKLQQHRYTSVHTTVYTILYVTYIPNVHTTYTVIMYTTYIVHTIIFTGV